MGHSPYVNVLGNYSMVIIVSHNNLVRWMCGEETDK